MTEAAAPLGSEAEPPPEGPRSTSAVGRRSAYVQPGQIFVSGEPAEAVTVLGSCVSVCLWDGRRRIGGINHFLLPYMVAGSLASPRFGTVATEELLAALWQEGSRPEDLTAKLFGGAAVIEAFRRGDDHLGARNVEAARRVLEERRIPIVAEDVLGSRGRKLIFHTGTGVALVRLI
jgi:chemotaxis protein CheD